MDLWHPPADEPQLLEWWQPLLLASRHARTSQLLWPIHIDDFELRGRVDRGERPRVWIYAHKVSRGELYLDDRGCAYKFTKTPNGPGAGRFTDTDLRRALFAAGMHRVVEPVVYREPPDEAWTRRTPTDVPLAFRRGHLGLVLN
jgi:hypothetical protein